MLDEGWRGIALLGRPEPAKPEVERLAALAISRIAVAELRESTMSSWRIHLRSVSREIPSSLAVAVTLRRSLASLTPLARKLRRV